ncbi:class I adenylate-forming enzyme family protein [Nocardiopsis coralliicola]
MLHPAGPDTGGTDRPATLDAAWARRAAAAPDAPAIAYFDRVLSGAETDRAAGALAAALADRGVGPGDRVGIALQNIPHYALALLALWKLGAAALVLNPMYRGAELRRIVDDAEPVGVLAAGSRTGELRADLEGSTVRWITGADDRDFQTRGDPRAFTGPADTSADGDSVGDLLRRYDGRQPPEPAHGPDAIALLTYTSGTTGPPKGAMNTHANVLAVTATFGDWAGIEPGDSVLAIAPLFHITGAVINAAVALVRGAQLVFANRFHPEVALEAMAEHRVTFTVGSITAYNALYGCPAARPEHFAHVKALYSGGAPIPPATVERFRERFGPYIHNAYGMTETTSGVIAVPRGTEAPVDPGSGSLSIGRPLPGTAARVVTPGGTPLPAGSQGELELTGPAVVPGYWRAPEATAATLPGGRLRTGDVAVIDADGWVYLVDRLKDQINVSGFKVWPREVEDALYLHPAVYEAGVVGRPDDYRGESVVAYVALAEGAAATPEELIAFTRDHLAAYKRPREIHLVDALPKTLTGKIRRRALREQG